MLCADGQCCWWCSWPADLVALYPPCHIDLMQCQIVRWCYHHFTQLRILTIFTHCHCCDYSCSYAAVLGVSVVGGAWSSGARCSPSVTDMLGVAMSSHSTSLLTSPFSVRIGFTGSIPSHIYMHAHEHIYSWTHSHSGAQVTQELVDAGILGKSLSSPARIQFQELVMGGETAIPYDRFVPFTNTRTNGNRTIITPNVASPEFQRRFGLSHHFSEVLKGVGGRKKWGSCGGYKGSAVATSGEATSEIEKVRQALLWLCVYRVCVRTLGLWTLCNKWNESTKQKSSNWKQSMKQRLHW